jgi:5-(carboxyamino)imidazole ribonucleotide synthase
MLVAIVGGGQLGMMLAEAGAPLGMTFRLLDPSPNAPAAAVAPLIVGGYDDRERLAELIDGVDVATYEFENVPVEAAAWMALRVAVAPPPVALETAQDRLNEKALFDKVGLAAPPYAAVSSLDDLAAAIETVGLPAVLKTRRLGYDGKGQAVVRERDDAESSWRAIGEVPAILERLVAFDRELSIIGARGADGATVFYPLVENVHRDGILRITRAPAPDTPPGLQRRAEDHARAVMDHLGYVGVLAIELFQTGDDLLGNEMAPRVHNSGHWTIEGAATSQFENHLRAIGGLPLGATDAKGPCAMINLIGTAPPSSALDAIPGAHVHLYGKAPRPGRKLGHVTVLADDPATLEQRIVAVLAVMED